MLINRPLPPGVVHGPSPDHFYIILREFERRTLYIRRFWLQAKKALHNDAVFCL